MFSFNKSSCGVLLATILLASGCGDDDVTNPDIINEVEVFTTVIITLTPQAGGDPIVASFRDDDGDGGNAPTVDPITLQNGTTYTATLTFLNELPDEAVDMTEEVEEESDEHQVFFTGDAVQGPASNSTNSVVTHAYADQDDGNLPIGLSNTFTTTAVGTGDMTITLRHLPELNDTAVKVAGLADIVANGSISDLPGDSDISATFTITVQ